MGILAALMCTLCKRERVHVRGIIVCTECDGAKNWPKGL
jgi:hypothetical protein